MIDPGQDGEPTDAATSAGPSYGNMGCGCLLVVLGGLIGLVGLLAIAAFFPPPGLVWLVWLPFALVGAPVIAAGCYLMITPWRAWSDGLVAGPFENDDEPPSGS